MDKRSRLDKIDDIKRIHMQNTNSVNYLIRGILDQAELVPLAHDECAFGKWLVKEEAFVTQVFNVPFHQNLHSLHSRWHDEYAKIHEIYFGPKVKKGLFGKLKRAKKKLSKMEAERAKTYFEDLKKTHQELVRQLDLMHRRVNALAD